MNEEHQSQGTVPQDQPGADKPGDQPGTGDPAAQKDHRDDGDKLKVEEKALAGFLLIFFTVFAMALIVRYWPDRLP